MSFERDRLFDALPRPYRRDPMAVPTLALGYVGTGALAIDIADGTLRVRGIDGAPSVTVDLESGLSFAALVAILQALPQTVAGLVDPGAGAVRAATLLDEADRIVVGTSPADFSGEFAPSEFLVEGGAVFGRFTSPLWILLDPIRQALKRKVVDLDVAVAQLRLLSSAGFFADYWGRHTVTVRRPGEGDDAYTARQRHELIRPRENNVALALLLEEDTGESVLEVADLYPEVFRLNTGRLNHHRLAGWYYNAASCEVRLAGFPTAALIAATQAHVAAGVMAFVTGQLPLTEVATGYALGPTALRAGPPPSMQIGVTPIGVGKIG